MCVGRNASDRVRVLGVEAVMHLRTLAVWNAAGAVRRIDFHAGLNILTGSSQTGKSTLIDILSYCLGSSEFRVPAGPIADNVAYYGLLIEIDGTPAFLGRPPLPTGQQTTTQAQLEIGMTELPPFDALRPTTNTDELEQWVGTALGIDENRFEPPAGATRRPLVANLSHALVHCFQSQDEIASRQILFHRQVEQFLPAAIRDTLPYFLGVTGPEQLRKAALLRDLQRNLRDASQRRRAIEETLTAGVGEAHALLSQAADAGLTAVDIAPPEALPEAIALLGEVRDAPLPASPRQPPGDEFDRLQGERRDLTAQLRGLRDQRALAAAIARGGDDATAEGIEQVVRLQSVGLLAVPDEPEHCPVCEQPLTDHAPPAVAELNTALGELETQIEAVARDRPTLVDAQSALREHERQVTERIEANREALDALAASTAAVAGHQERLDIGTWVRGRIDYYLEKASAVSDANVAALQAAEDQLRQRIDTLAEELDPDRIRDAATSALVSIGARTMTPMAQRLGLEHADLNVRIDLGRLTVVADKPTGAVYMDSGIGSAKNWVGYHLAATLGLQDHFVREGRPVPSFLVLDQPTQAFFPSDRPQADVADQDRQDALAQFELFRDAVGALDGRLQVIVLDHADFDEAWFQDAVVEKWRDGRALIPASWYSAA